MVCPHVCLYLSLRRRQARERDQDRLRATLAYDNLHRLTSRSYPTAADNVAFAYDLLGRRTQASFADASHTVAYVWDAWASLPFNTSPRARPR